MGLASSACCQDATPVEAKEVVQESADPSGHSVANSPHEGIIDLQKLQLDMDCESGTATATTSVPARPTRLGVPSPCPTASSATRSRSANPRNLRNLTRLQIDQDLLRGISLRRSLRNFGKLWTHSPLDLPDADRAGLWDHSQQVERLNTFLSHTWATPGWQKVLSLLVQSGGVHFLLGNMAAVERVFQFSCGWLFGALLGVALDLSSVLPPLLSFPCTESLQCERGIWVRVFGFLGSVVGLWGSPYIPHFHHEMCFLDVVSINQVDEDLMGRGIYGLGGFLAVSSELRILWSKPYLTRLWCIFEMAAFRRANPTGKIILKPLLIETFVVGAVFSLNMWELADEIRVHLTVMGFLSKKPTWDKATALLLSATNPLQFLSLFFAFWCFYQCRRFFREKLEVVENLKHFDLDKVSCRTAEDREFIYHGIRMWYGSTEAFEEYVRGTLAFELTEPFTRTHFPFLYWLMVLTPLFSVGLDSCLSRLRSNTQQELLPLFYFCITVSFNAPLMMLLCGRWILFLGERFAPKAKWRLVDFGKTLLMGVLVVVPTGISRTILVNASERPLAIVLLFIGLIICVLVFQHWPRELWRRCSKISA
eukprot:s407_g13.t4